MKKKSPTSKKKSINKKSKSVNKPLKEKGLGLFDHVKQVKSIQDPKYFSTLSDTDKKTFNHFMILRTLSMNPFLLDDVSVFYKYFDKVPSAQFYTLLISLIPLDRRFYPWVKGQKKYSVGKKAIELIATKFEVSTKEAEDYAFILEQSNKVELVKLCQGFGLTEKEVNNILDNKEDNEYE